MQSRRKLKIGFPNIGKLFGVRSGARRSSVVSLISDTTVRSRQSISGVAGRTGSSAGSGLLKAAGVSSSGAVKKVKEAMMRFEFGPATAIGGMFVVAVLLVLVYLGHFNQVATKGYDLRRLEADRQQLMNQYDIKNMKLAEVKSLAKIIESDRIGGMRRPAEVTYVRGNTALASR